MGVIENYQAVKEEIRQCCEKFDRKSHPRLLAVSKNHSAEDIRLLYGAGQIWFGENYLSELVEKKAGLADLQVRWSYIGPIQSKKIKKLVSLCDEIQTVSEGKHLELICESVKTQGRSPIDIFLQVNLGREEQKSGVLPEDLPALLAKAEAAPGINLLGLMVIPPQIISEGEDPEASHGFFSEARLLANGVGQGLLSIGMSADMDLAIQHGSDCVRIGTAIFGSRDA